MSEFTLLVQTRDPDVVYQECECTCPSHIAEIVLRAILKDFSKATAVSVKITASVTMPPLLVKEIMTREARKEMADGMVRDFIKHHTDEPHPVATESEETIS